MTRVHCDVPMYNVYVVTLILCDLQFEKLIPMIGHIYKILKKCLWTVFWEFVLKCDWFQSIPRTSSNTLIIFFICWSWYFILHACMQIKAIIKQRTKRFDSSDSVPYLGKTVSYLLPEGCGVPRTRGTDHFVNRTVGVVFV